MEIKNNKASGRALFVMDAENSDKIILATKAGVEGHRLQIHTPLIGLTKAEIIKTGTSLDVDYALTHSCYSPDNDGRHCGQCDACLLRRRGFEQAKVTDPTLYAI